jgi:hypothetical protein
MVRLCDFENFIGADFSLGFPVALGIVTSEAVQMWMLLEL